MNKGLLIFLLFLSACANTGTSQQNDAVDSTLVDTQMPDTDLRLSFKSGVRSILEDSQGNFWFGSHQEGVCMFDGQTFQYFTTNDGLSDNQVRSIQEDQAGHIWFGTGNGITEYDGQKFTKYADRTDLKMNNYLGTIGEISPDDLWFPGNDTSGKNWYSGQSGAYRYDGENLVYMPFPIPENHNPTNPLSVTGIAKGNKGNVWFGTYPAVIGYDGKGFTFLDEETFAFTDKSGIFHVRSVFEDSRGNLWIGNNGAGVLKSDGNSFVNFTEQNGLALSQDASPSLARVFSIGEDRYGNIWFGDRDTGAWCYNPKLGNSKLAFTNYPAAHVWDIYQDRSGDLWFALDNGSVCEFNGEALVRVY